MRDPLRGSCPRSGLHTIKEYISDNQISILIHFIRKPKYIKIDLKDHFLVNSDDFCVKKNWPNVSAHITFDLRLIELWVK